MFFRLICLIYPIWINLIHYPYAFENFPMFDRFWLRNFEVYDLIDDSPWFCTSLYTHIRFRLHRYNNRSCNLVGSVFPQIGKVLTMASRSRAFSQSQSVSVADSRIRLEYFCRKQYFSASCHQLLLSQEVPDESNFSIIIIIFN